jgi:hypothetical protein
MTNPSMHEEKAEHHFQLIDGLLPIMKSSHETPVINS